MSDHKPYKPPIIVRSKNDWFIKLFYEYPDQKGKYKEFRFRDGVNYLDNLDDREAAVQELLNDVIFALEKKGLNPFEKIERASLSAARKLKEVKEKNRPMTLTEAVEWLKISKKAKNKGDKYLREYTWLDNHFIPWCKDHGLIAINQPTIDDLELFLAEKLESEDWAPRTYNNKVSILTSFFNYLASKRKLSVNPIIDGALERIDNKAEKNKYYDRKTLEKVLPEVQKQKALRRYIQWTYYTCARGTELRALRIRDIDLEIKKIVIMAESGKTGVHVGKRNIPLCIELNNLILGEGLEQMPGDWYVFGKDGMPGPEKIYHNYFSDLYFDIKKNLSIDFKYSIYSFKHTRVVDLLVAGFDPVKVMHLTGHTNWGSFQAYIRELGAVMDKQMIGNTLELAI